MRVTIILMAKKAEESNRYEKQDRIHRE